MSDTCSTCEWWYCGPGRYPVDTERGERRECHVNAPVVLYRAGTPTIVTLFPGTQHDDSCGQWEACDETD
jgi:hypothetical protein